MPTSVDLLQRFTERFVISPGRTLVVGSKIHGICVDRRMLYDNAVGVDMDDGDGVDIVHDMENPLPKKYGKFEHIDCHSVLEHCRRPWRMASNIEQIMWPDATILVTAPFVWREHGYPNDYWRFTRDSLKLLFPGIQWQCLSYIDEWRERRKPAISYHENRRWLARTEVAGFGRKAA